MEPAHEGIAGRQRDDREAGIDVFGEFGVIARGEGQFPFHADRACGHAQRALGRDMDRFWLEFLEAARDILAGAEGELDFRIGRQRHGLVAEAGMDHLDFMAHGAAFGDGARQGAHDPVHLWLPGIGHQHDALRLVVAAIFRIGRSSSVIVINVGVGAFCLFGHRVVVCLLATGGARHWQARPVSGPA